jgi:trans-aconitate methyltransferase
MEKKRTFNTVADDYNKFRPTYPIGLYTHIFEYMSYDEGPKALEIGIGTGQATQPILDKGISVTAVELGSELAKYSRTKYQNYPEFNVINQEFHAINLNERFNLIYSASAFHWIPVDVGLPKVKELLADQGAFAWFSIQPGPSEEHNHIHLDIQKVYNQYPDYFPIGKTVYERAYIKQLVEDKQSYRVKVLKEYGFKSIETKNFYGSRTFSAEDYIRLISTYSDHNIIPEPTKTEFLEKVKDAINKHGGFFTLDDTYPLCMAKR